jgi:peroxiredoxin
MNRILLAVAAVAIGGGLAYWLVTSQMAAMDEPLNPAEDPRNAVVSPSKIHPVTGQMSTKAAALAETRAPDFALKDERGGSYTLQEMARTKPVLLYFIVDTCPCCVTAQPAVERVREAYEGVLTVAGVINADATVAAKWAKNNGAKFPILLDPTKATIHAYKAERGTYMALIAPGGNIQKVYPGYSQTLVKDLVARIAQLARVPAKSVQVDDLPTDDTTGCEFDPAK